MNRSKLTEDEIAKKLRNLGGWSVKDKWLKRKYEFKNFAKSLEFVNQVGEIAEEADHHPDITFGWGYVNIELTTHDTGGLTERDFDVASKIEVL